MQRRNSAPADLPHATSLSQDSEVEESSHRINIPRSEGSPMEDGSDPIETYLPVLRQGGDQDSELNRGEGVQQTPESPLELFTSLADVHVTPAVIDSTPLSLQCRICDAPPTVGTRPTVTMCGHLFCSEYVLRIPATRTLGSLYTRCITRRLMSTSRCPVCDDALLLHCLFKLDLPALS